MVRVGSFEVECEACQTVHELGAATEHYLFFECRCRPLAQGVQEVAIGIRDDFADIIVPQTLVKVPIKFR